MTATLDAGLVLGVPEESLLGALNRHRVLAPADIHVARRLARLADESDELVLLATAFAVRAPRLGHVWADLGSLRETAEEEIEDEADLGALPWPEPGAWLERVEASPLVAVGEAESEVAPLRLVGSSLYLDRYWRDERAVAADLLARSAEVPPGDASGGTAVSSLREAISQLFGAEDDAEQRWAVAVSALRGLAVVAGGPGTGKTTTVARLIGLLAEQSATAGSEPPLVALAAPTGKAANRMQEAVRAAAVQLPVSEAVRRQLLALEASTVHRLLRPYSYTSSRFRYHRRNRLPHDVVVVDETSMLSLWLMARLVEAVREDARLVFVGDPEQLVSVEAGAVLGDIVGPASSGLRMHARARRQVREATGADLSVVDLPEESSAIGDGVVLLSTNHRFGGVLARLAEAVRRGDADEVIGVLRDPAGDKGGGTVDWLPVDAAEAGEHELAPIRLLACDAGRSIVDAARLGDGAGALAALGSWRILCAHRRGPAGVSAWNERVERWLSAEIEAFSTGGEWYVGRPVIVTANDYGLRLFNGDTGVLVARDPVGVEVAFERGPISPSRLSEVDTVYSMTVHKAQGSEFDSVAVVLPQPSSRLLTRQLLYTAVTRARNRLLIASTEESLRAAVERPIARASGLTERLWGASR
ncbi:MAG TPA: exodeoxyribonuclease V subunit alpha [Acidimicrobiales bacterium]|nr:exodeoxyribonuclease V subunit alpha [Acidimicrobiales bacterium]